MRLLIVTQYFWPESFRINEIVRTLVEKGVQVDVLTGKPNYPEGKIRAGYRMWGCTQDDFHGATLYRVPLVPRGKGKLRLAINYLSFILFGSVCGPWVTRHRQYDAVFVYGLSPILLALPGLLIGKLKHVPVVVWVQDLWPQSLSATGYVRNGLILKAVEKMVRFIYSRSNLLLIQSRAFEKHVKPLAAHTPIKYYPNSVDDIFSNPNLSTPVKCEGLGEGFSILFAGNIGQAQAVGAIIDAADLLKDYPDIQFVVLGDGSKRQWMLETAKKLNLRNIHLPGRFPLETMPGFMRQASALLVTLADQQIFAATVPNKIQAYLASGRPILACLNGEGARLVLKAEAGLAVPAEDGKALANAVIDLYKMAPAKRDAMGANGRNYYQAHFNHDRLVDQLIVELQCVIGK